MSTGMFTVLGPITVGPSSSHTAGAVRVGLAARTILGEPVRRARVVFFGSFADTYKGHGTDKAVVGGLMGWHTNDERIRDSLHLAEEAGMEVRIVVSKESTPHPNTVEIEAMTDSGAALSLRGISVGGGAIRLVRLNGLPIDVACNLDTTIVFHNDAPGVLAGLSRILFDRGYNISNLSLNRERRYGDVITVIETDAPLDRETVDELRAVNSVENVVVIPKF